MASLGARAARLLLRATVRTPIQRAVGKPHFLKVARATFNGGAMIFGHLPRGAAMEPFSGGVGGEWVFPKGGAKGGATILYLHGGGYVANSAAWYRVMTGTLALECDARVLVPEYRLAPEHPFPAALNDATAAYEWLLAHGIAAERIVVAGDSAGGGLTLSLLLAVRDAGLPLPAGAMLFSPWLDLQSTGESVQTNAHSDDVVVNDRGNLVLAKAYMNGLPLDHPVASGLYADPAGLPPLLIQASEIEVLRDDAVRFGAKARAAGVDARVRLWDGVPHVWHLFARLPESREAFADVAAFVREVTSAKN